MRRVPPFAIGSHVWPGLGKVVEEKDELGQVVGKLMAYPSDPHPSGEDLHAKFIEESGDLLAALWYATDANGVWQEVQNRAITKYARFRIWHREERGEGEFAEAAAPGKIDSSQEANRG